MHTCSLNVLLSNDILLKHVFLLDLDEQRGTEWRKVLVTTQNLT